jgi:hypothetical protein
VAASGQEDDDPLRESRAYNQSIYLFVATPYVLLGAVGFLVYRGMKKASQTTAVPKVEGTSAVPPITGEADSSAFFSSAAAGGPLHVDTAEPPAVREPGPDGGGPDGAG